MNAIDRVTAVIEGRRLDRPPYSFWHHFRPDQVYGPTAVAAHVGHLERYDLDFLKVMNDNDYPHEGLIHDVRDLNSLVELRGDEPLFARQLQLLSDLRAALNGRVFMTTTIFNAWAVLRRLIRPPAGHKPPDLDAGPSDEPSRRIKALLAQDAGAVTSAIARIGRSLANFARRCIEAGADGIFLSCRDDWVDVPDDTTLYDRLVRPSDLEILAAASAGRFNMLHVCGRPVNFRPFANYPVHVINWADRSAGPSIAQVKDWIKPAICAGVDNQVTLPQGTPANCEKEVADALRQAGDRPIMIAPGCTYDPDRVPPDNLHAVARAAAAHRYAGAR
jgi:uroporphyrinogen decarboxylase